MRIAVEIDVTFDQKVLSQRSEARRVFDLDPEELTDKIAIAVSECAGIEDVAGVERVKLVITPEAAGSTGRWQLAAGNC